MAGEAADFQIREEEGIRVLVLVGDWTVLSLGNAARRAGEVETPCGRADVSALGEIDSAGALLIEQICDGDPDLIGEHSGASDLLALVSRADQENEPPTARGNPVIDLLERTGRASMKMWREMQETLAFLGQALVTCARVLMQPHKLRLTATVAVMEEAGLDALPIVAFLSFFVGMVVAFIGATSLSDFGATIFTVELVGIAMMREFGVVLTGVILAGRTNSAFTAQIGAMRMRQEIDAMTTLGLPPMEVLVAPRIFAMVLMTPVLTFVATLAGICGGIVVGWLALDINPVVFATRLQDYVPIQNFWVGMSKAPIFGLVVALIGCRQGLKVGGSVQSLGHHTTTSVVQALFSVIVIDAVFAIFYMELDI